MEKHSIFEKEMVSHYIFLHKYVTYVLFAITFILLATSIFIIELLYLAGVVCFTAICLTIVYVSNKKKYGIGDGFIMLELTESFAFDDNRSIVQIVDSLHQNGIKCSLDDFGAGFSSFSMLKNIALDELKLDRCFIEKDDSPEKGDMVLKTVIGLFKSLGITVVQEGVETEEMLKKIAEYGCDVMQGFYYAKAIPLEEFKLFLKSNTSIMYKSKVK